MRNYFEILKRGFQLPLLITLISVIVYACSTSTGNPGNAPQLQTLPVIELKNTLTTLYEEYSASLEGTRDIEIRPQVEGYLDKIFVDEGAHVKAGQPLFKVNDRIYVQQLNNAKAALSAARANLANAQINVSRIRPLVEQNVVSDVQLKTAQAGYDAAAANVLQAEAMVSHAQTNLGYTLIKAPSSGYIGRIPLKSGSLVGLNTPEALTVLSEIKDIYAYFSLSENNFLQFKNQYPGNSIEEKLKQLPPVELILADNTIYPKKGRVQTISGQFNNTTGAISLRASFPNEGGLLRSGNTGIIRIPRTFSSALLVPQEATFELQDKVFVFILSDSNKVASVPITISGRSGNFYVVEKGLKPGDKIVYSGLDRLREGVMIKPESLSMDSLLKTKSL
ncbi:MAG TPA: efflux RND transporter periplasmic adaptor subunit [Chitinophagaceae bacterium]|nr:efflux RND transporter periplasmic adaptor subunit [Chitinophagaceae bacterium]